MKYSQTHIKTKKLRRFISNSVAACVCVNIARDYVSDLTLFLLCYFSDGESEQFNNHPATLIMKLSLSLSLCFLSLFQLVCVLWPLPPLFEQTNKGTYQPSPLSKDPYPYTLPTHPFPSPFFLSFHFPLRRPLSSCCFCSYLLHTGNTQPILLARP